MDLKSAIEKAGPGGKIKRKSWVDPNWIQLPAEGKYYERFIDSWGNRVDYIQACDIIAENWEVAQDEIEVGDEVERSGQGGLVVVAVDMNPVAEACIRYMDGSLDVHEISSLTLIRKGGKKRVYNDVENVEWWEGEDAYKYDMDNPNAKLRMTLEEIDG